MKDEFFRNILTGRRKNPSMDSVIPPVNDKMTVRKRLGDILFLLSMLGLCSAICWGLKMLNSVESNIVVLYIFFVFLISVWTARLIYSILAAVLSVVIYNYLFTAPEFTLHAYDSRYTVSFAIMFLIALLTGVLAARLRKEARDSSRMVFRIGVLYDTNKLLEKCKSQEEIKDITAKQLVRLLHRNLILYRDKESLKSGPAIFLSNEEEELDFSPEMETKAAESAFQKAEKTGRGTDTFPDSVCVYMAIRLNQAVFGVVGIDVRNNELDTYEESMVIAILGEAGIALENKRNEQEKEQAMLMAKNEQFRANLLRSISHDLRTPLTSISGTASLLLSDADRMDDCSRKNLYTNIYDDSMWLEGLVENLLSITRLKDGQTRIHTSVEFVNEVMEEAGRHCSRKLSEHKFSIEEPSEVLLGKMDAHLIIQVLVNLVNNAVKYTPAGSSIRITAEKIPARRIPTGQTNTNADQSTLNPSAGMIQISVIDDGPGLSESDRPHIFEMFYTGKKTVADSSRSLGLGLALCQVIVQAHGGRIWYEDNAPHGSIFRFTIPAEEVRADV
ncbi:MAG: DUF4118 domain-containing protein [Lachnospiraceae bacterium]|nr:DUF4118 domain-containing protein [Lachnospiraceae bacterium]